MRCALFSIMKNTIPTRLLHAFIFLSSTSYNSSKMSVKCLALLSCLSVVLACDEGVDLPGTGESLCGINNDGLFRCSCPWSSCTVSTAEEFQAKGLRGGDCETTGFTIAFIVIIVVVTIALIILCSWCCCCKGAGCSCTKLCQGGICCQTRGENFQNTPAPAYHVNDGKM